MSNKVTVAVAARTLNVAPNTVRAWADKGALRCRRHPINGYRLFDVRSLKALKKRISS